jgi:hypothetical protein
MGSRMRNAITCSRIDGFIRSSGMIPVGDIDGGCSVMAEPFRSPAP